MLLERVERLQCWSFFFFPFDPLGCDLNRPTTTRIRADALLRIATQNERKVVERAYKSSSRGTEFRV